MEQPVLRLGLLGFDPAAQARLTAWVAQVQPGWPAWLCGDPHRADAWMIRGGAVAVHGRDGVVIHHPFGSGERWLLNRAEVDRPLAFACPLPVGFASAEFFEADDEAAVRQRLQRFEAWLRPLRSQFALGGEVVRRMGAHKGAVVHLLHEERLLAVIDFRRWQAGLLVPARPVDLAMAQWVRQAPGSPVEIPPAFIRLPLQRVMWTYAVRTRLDILPPRYRDRRIYLRRVPLMPVRWFDELHLALMRALLAAPDTLDALRQRVDAPLSSVAHHLAALYYAGALTTDSDSARRAELQTWEAVAQLTPGAEGAVAAPSARSAPAGSTLPLYDAVHSPLRRPLDPPPA